MRNNHNNGKRKNTAGLDIHAISLLGVEARGEVAWAGRLIGEDRSVLGEAEYAHNMSKCPLYWFTDGGMKDKPDYQRIADELNKVYHRGRNVRDRYSVRNAIYRYRKKK